MTTQLPKRQLPLRRPTAARSPSLVACDWARQERDTLQHIRAQSALEEVVLQARECR